MWPPSRYTASIPRVNSTRLRRSGMRNTLARPSKNLINPCLLPSTALLLLRLLLFRRLRFGFLWLFRGRRRLGFRRRGRLPRRFHHRWLRRLDHLRGPAGLLDLLRRRLREYVSPNGDAAVQLAIAEHLESGRARLANDAELQQVLGVEAVALEL